MQSALLHKTLGLVGIFLITSTFNVAIGQTGPVDNETLKNKLLEQSTGAATLSVADRAKLGQGLQQLDGVAKKTEFPKITLPISKEEAQRRIDQEKNKH